jgi:CheY-like chemotaxis protein
MAKRRPEPYAPSILVVDDDARDRTLVRRILEDAGYYVAEAASGREGFQFAKDRFFEVVVVDISMPDMDGFELLRAIRSELPDVKALLVSGYMAGTFLSIAEKLGAAATLDKALASENLLPAVCLLIASV